MLLESSGEWISCLSFELGSKNQFTISLNLNEIVLSVLFDFLASLKMHFGEVFINSPKKMFYGLTAMLHFEGQNNICQIMQNQLVFSHTNKYIYKLVNIIKQLGEQRISFFKELYHKKQQ